MGLDDDARTSSPCLGDLIELLVEGWRIDADAVRRPLAGVGRRRRPTSPSRAASTRRAGVLRARRRPGALPPRPRRAVPREPGDLEAPLLRDGRRAGARGPPTRRRTGARCPSPSRTPLVLGAGDPARASCPVSQAQSAGGLDIALVALERHDGGARLRYMCHASDARTRGEMRMLDVIAVDDGGAALPRGARPSAQPRATACEGDLVVAPAIPQDVRPPDGHDRDGARRGRRPAAAPRARGCSRSRSRPGA